MRWPEIEAELASSQRLSSIVLRSGSEMRHLFMLALHAKQSQRQSSSQTPKPQLQFIVSDLLAAPINSVFLSTLILFLLLSHTLSVHRCQVQKKTSGVNALVLAPRYFLKKIGPLAELFCRLPICIYHCLVLTLNSNGLTTFELA